jgi:peroxiredoxin
MSVMPAGPIARSRVALIAFAAFSIWINWQAKKLDGVSDAASGAALVGREPPRFTLAATDGRNISLDDLLNKKKVAIIFWASWCGPCRMELPVVRDFYEKARPMRDDFEILAISLDEYADAAAGAASSMHLPFPVLVNGEKVAGAYGVVSIPQLFIIDKSGKVTYAQGGFNTGLEALLAQSFGLDLKRFMGETNGSGH